MTHGIKVYKNYTCIAPLSWSALRIYHNDCALMECVEVFTNI